MRLRLVAVVVAACLSAVADDSASIDSVVATVRAALRKKIKDADLAVSLDKVKLPERLEDRIIEILESEGAGPQCLGALQRLRDASRLLPVPPVPPPGMTPPPFPSSDEEYTVWQATRLKARDYTRSLPDFVCSETIHRWTDPTGTETWQPSPTVVADLAFLEGKENYKLRSVGGHPSDKSLPDVGGAVSQGEFGSLLAEIFDPASETDYRWDHWTRLRKRPAYVFFFRVSVAHAPQHLAVKMPDGKSLTAAAGFRGYVYVDRETNSVLRISEEAEDMPADFPVQKSSIVLDYDYAEIGGRQFLLPLRAEIRVDAGPLQSLNSVEFQAYRKFSADTAVQFRGVPRP